MKIAIVASHAWPIPNDARTGDIYVLDLAKGLEALGHDVTLFAPEGTRFTNVRHTRCAYGKFTPTSLEYETLTANWDELCAFDIVHDHSTAKVVGHKLADFNRPVCMTITGGPWRDKAQPVNLCAFSASQAERVRRGATDYEGSPTPDDGGPPGVSLWALGKDVHAVPAGVDTDFYCPTDYAKDSYALWLNRWHPVKGYELAVRIAKETGMHLVMAGVHPDHTTNAHEREHAFRAQDLAAPVPSIDFRWLPYSGHDEAKRDLYRRARCLLYPVQFQEPFGLSMAEALACGTPVVGSRMGSVPEIVRPGLTGMLANLDAGVVHSFAEGVMATRDFNGAICREQAFRNFSREAMAKRYLAEYERITNGERW